MVDLSYPNILSHIAKHNIKGRTESAAFLIWYLENYYRLDDAVDYVCDNNGDKGVDGIFVNDDANTINVFQTKISQKKSSSIGDRSLREFEGTLSQFENPESLKNLIDTAGRAEVSGLIERLGIKEKLSDYKIVGYFISNTELDKNGIAFLQSNKRIFFIGKSELESSYISETREVPPGTKAEFDIEGVSTSKHYADADVFSIIAPVRAKELVKLQGIKNQSIFAFNIRGPLGKTQVNRDIVKSIKNSSLHKQFPLFHNGITVICDKINDDEHRIEIENYFVVNGCQSLYALFDNQKELTDDLRILTKFVQVKVNSDLTEIITNFSNNQNGVRARDFKSNDPTQIRLQNEFNLLYKDEFFYEIKRGENISRLTTISNEMAGTYLMSFDLQEPWISHRKYQIFEDKHSMLFARQLVTADRIVALYIMDEVIKEKIDDINNQLFGKYILTRYTILYILRLILEIDNKGKELIASPEEFVRDPRKRQNFKECIENIVNDIIVDINAEVDELGDDFDYRSKLRDESWVKELAKKVSTIYLKTVKRDRIESFEKQWLKLPLK